ncbi:hypothetical protein D3C85_1321730 [compost metagenome]
MERAACGCAFSFIRSDDPIAGAIFGQLNRIQHDVGAIAVHETERLAHGATSCRDRTVQLVCFLDDGVAHEAFVPNMYRIGKFMQAFIRSIIRVAGSS